MSEVKRKLIKSLVNSYFIRDVSGINCEHVCEAIDDEYFDRIDQSLSVDDKELCLITCGETLENNVVVMELLSKIKEQEPIGVIEVPKAEFVSEFLDNCMYEAGKNYGFDEAGIKKLIKEMGY